MIPADLAARLRMLTDATFFGGDQPLAALQRPREILSQLPDLIPGQRFQATLQRALPDGTFRALVAGQQMTLALSTSAQPGDTLELVVTQTTPKAVFAQLAEPEQNVPASSAQPSLSQTGKLISVLLTGQPATKPTDLSPAGALASAPPTQSGSTLAPALKQAVAQSGLFYEAHLARWVGGKADTAMLLREPQGQLSPLARAIGLGLANLAGTDTGDTSQPVDGRTSALPGHGALPVSASRAEAINRGPDLLGGTLAGTRTEGETEARTGAADSRAAALGNDASTRGAGPIPERLMPVVHQQLDALATQTYVWQGQIWPGQTMEWEIEDNEQGQGEAGEDGPNWNTTVRITLPRLGGIEARLHLTPVGVAVRLVVNEEQAAQRLSDGQALLANALEAANLPLTGMVVERAHGG